MALRELLIQDEPEKKDNHIYRAMFTSKYFQDDDGSVPEPNEDEIAWNKTFGAGPDVHEFTNCMCSSSSNRSCITRKTH